MGQPRRKFPGGSVGSFCIIHGDYKDFLTEGEALKKAQELANSENKRMYVFQYVNHVDPEDNLDA